MKPLYIVQTISTDGINKRKIILLYNTPKKKKKTVREEKKGNSEKKVFISLTRSSAITNIPNHDTF